MLSVTSRERGCVKIICRLRRRNILFWGCVESLLPPTAAEYSSERHVIFTISRSEIVKMTCRSKHHSARSAKIIFEINIIF
jgi:hypothetical protein